jgi:hypothetical protein
VRPPTLDIASGKRRSDPPPAKVVYVDELEMLRCVVRVIAGARVEGARSGGPPTITDSSTG